MMALIGNKPKYWSLVSTLSWSTPNNLEISKPSLL